MPVYRYKCTVCGHCCDTLKDRCDSNADSQICVDCGGLMKRIMTGIGATFKGSGFYSTDYKKGNLR